MHIIKLVWIRIKSNLLSAADAAGENPREVMNAARLCGELCGVESREDELLSVGCLDTGEWLGVDLQDGEDSAAEERSDPGICKAGESGKLTMQ